MKKYGVASLLLSAFSLTSLACGPDSGNKNIVGGPSCTEAPCGGNIAGTWNATGLCVDKSVLMAAFSEGLMGQCPQAALGDVNFVPTGSFVFNTDGSYQIALTLNGTLGVNVPVSCLNGGTCADLAASFASGSSAQSATCTGTSTCNCTIIEAPDTLSESGTYSTSGNSLLTTPTGSVSPDTVDYCVKGSTLTFREPVMEAMQSGFMAFVAMKS